MRPFLLLILALAVAPARANMPASSGRLQVVAVDSSKKNFWLKDLSGTRDPETGGLYAFIMVCGMSQMPSGVYNGASYSFSFVPGQGLHIDGLQYPGCAYNYFTCEDPTAHWDGAGTDAQCVGGTRPPPPAAPAPAPAPTPAPTPAAAPSPAPGMSRAEIQAMVDSAAQKAAQQAAAKASAPQEGAGSSSDPFSSDVDKPSYHESARPDDIALIVGVEKYDELPSADYAERDAAAVRAHLLALGYAPRNVIVLTGHSASRAGLVKNIEKRLPELAKEDSTVFFYYSGHGAPDPATGKAYLVPIDGDPGFLDETGYPTARLYQKLGALRAKRVIVALDACFSGAGGRSVLAKGTRPLVTRINEGSVPAKVVSLTASASNQIAGTLKDQHHGAFTYYLLKGLSENRRTTKDLFEYLRPLVEDSARSDNRDQSPTMAGADEPLR